MKQLPLLHNGTDTSRAAAEQIEPRRPNLRGLVLDFVRACQYRGATIDEITLHLKMQMQTVCARRNELGKLGLVADSGQRRRTRSGNTAIVWIAKEYVR